MRRIIKVPIESVIPRGERRLVNIEKPLQSKEPILVDRIGDKYIVIDGEHRTWKHIELGMKNILIKIRRSLCLYCNRQLIPKDSNDKWRIDKGKKKFCSKKCHYNYRVEKKLYVGEKNPVYCLKREDLTLRNKSKENINKVKKALTGRIRSEKERISISKASRISRLKEGKWKGEKNPSFGKTGEKSHLWKGGITPLNNQIRTCLRYVEWRLAVFEKDNYTCQECGQVGGKLNVDHIIPFSKIMKDHNIKTIEHAFDCNILWDKSNGRTLCKYCHKKTETYGGRSIKLNNPKERVKW